MTAKYTLLAILLAAALATTSSRFAFGDEARPLAILPYKPLWSLANPNGLPEECKIEISFRIAEAGKPLPPPDLKMHIQFQDLKVPLRVSERGEFQLPLKREWAEENAMIVANQPKGSMSILVDLKGSGAINVAAGELEYRELMVLFHVLEGLSTPINTLTGQKLNERALELRFQLEDYDSDDREIIIHSDSGEITYRANDDGLILVPYSPLLFEENPIIEVPDGRHSFKFHAGGKDQDGESDESSEG